MNQTITCFCGHQEQATSSRFSLASSSTLLHSQTCANDSSGTDLQSTESQSMRRLCHSSTCGISFRWSGRRSPQGSCGSLHHRQSRKCRCHTEAPLRSYFHSQNCRNCSLPLLHTKSCRSSLVPVKSLYTAPIDMWQCHMGH